MLQETDDSLVVEAVYTVAPQASRYGTLVSQQRDSASSFYQFDAVGSTIQLTDETGVVTDEYVYTAFGEVESSTGSTENPYQWIGREGYYLDPGTARYNLRRREYQANIARFLQQDPLGSDADDGNLYRYVENDPVNQTDPSGLQGFGNAVRPSVIPWEGSGTGAVQAPGFLHPNSAGSGNTGPTIAPGFLHPNSAGSGTGGATMAPGFLAPNSGGAASGGPVAAPGFLHLSAGPGFVHQSTIQCHAGGCTSQPIGPFNFEWVTDNSVATGGDSCVVVSDCSQGQTTTSVASVGLLGGVSMGRGGAAVGTALMEPSPFGEAILIVVAVGTTAYVCFEWLFSVEEGEQDRRRKRRKSGQSGKEAANDRPSWAEGEAPYVGESGNEFAKRLLDEKYGAGNYRKGPGSEYNQLRKWGDRGFQNP